MKEGVSHMTGKARGFLLWRLNIYMEARVINQPPGLLEVLEILQGSSVSVKIALKTKPCWPEP